MLSSLPRATPQILAGAGTVSSGTDLWTDRVRRLEVWAGGRLVCDGFLDKADAASQARVRGAIQGLLPAGGNLPVSMGSMGAARSRGAPQSRCRVVCHGQWVLRRVLSTYVLEPACHAG